MRKRTQSADGGGEQSSRRLYQILILGGLALFLGGLLISGLFSGVAPMDFLSDQAEQDSGDLVSMPDTDDNEDDQETESNPEVGELEISDFESPERVNEGEPIEISFGIANVGNASVSTTVEIQFGSQEVHEEEFEIVANDTRSGTYSIETADLEAGEYQINLSTDEQTETRSVEIETDDNGDEEGEDPDESPELVVTDLDVPEEVTSDDSFEITYMIENRGEAGGETSVLVEFDDESVQEEEIQLSSGSSTQMTTTIDIGELEEGQYSVSVQTDDDWERELIRVDQEHVEEPEFIITELEATENATAGDDVQANYSIENRGNATGSKNLTLDFDGEEVLTDEVSLEPGESLSSTYTITTEEEDEGERSIELQVADDRAQIWIELQEQAEEDEEDDEDDDDNEDDDNGGGLFG